jgi:excisionase family DNA binding protein
MDRASKFYTIEEATDILGISEREIMNMITLQKLPAVKVEKSIKIREEDMENFLDSLGKAGDADGDILTEKQKNPAKTEGITGREKPGNEYEAEDRTEENMIKLEKSYKELLKKKQELEEDINYLQYKFDEFKNRIRRIISEEFQLFIRRIDEENLRDGDDVVENDFDNDEEIDSDIEDAEENDFNGNGEKLSGKDNGRIEKNLVSEKDNTIELKGRKTNNL